MPLRLAWPILVLLAIGVPAAASDRLLPVQDDDQGQAPSQPEITPDGMLHIPGMPPIRLAPGVHVFGSEGMELNGPMQGLQNGPSNGLGIHPQLPKPNAATREQRLKAAKAEALKRAMAPHPTHAALRAQALDTLFKRLAAASDPEEASGIAAAIEHVWMQSDSDTADLLMTRAMAAQQAGHLPLALTLYDRIVSLQPNWAEAWNKRATTRLLGDDMTGAVSDLEQALKLEPRHFSALVAMGFILEKEGLEKRALEAFRKALALNPQQPEIKSIVDKLQTEVEGRDI